MSYFRRHESFLTIFHSIKCIFYKYKIKYIEHTIKSLITLDHFLSIMPAGPITNIFS